MFVIFMETPRLSCAYHALDIDEAMGSGRFRSELLEGAESLARGGRLFML